MTRTARIEPIQDETQENGQESGWRVVDVTDPDETREVSRHDTEPQAIEAARHYERDTSNEPGSEPDDTQDYEGSDIPRG